MSDKFKPLFTKTQMRKRYFKKVIDKSNKNMHLTYMNFIPREFDGFKRAQKEARLFAGYFGESSYIVKKSNGKITFIPHGNLHVGTFAARAFRAFGAEVLDEVVCISI